LLALALGCATSTAPPEPVADEQGPAVVRAAECRWTTGPIRIDGVLDDVAWERAEEIKDFAVFWQNRKPLTSTSARLLWDRQYLYFGARMQDHDVCAQVQERNGQTWNDDVFELFLKPSPEKPAYYEFQVNAANTPLELFLPSRGAGGYHRFASGPRLGLESAVKVQGTLNHWEDRDVGWTVEGRIPWTAFQATGGRPKAGDRWRFALCRYDYSATLENPELSSTAPLTLPNFHRYEEYGELTFKGP
jgi:hypothetical protein